MMRFAFQNSSRLVHFDLFTVNLSVVYIRFLFRASISIYLYNLFFLITGLPVRPSHKMGFRSSVSKSGLPGEGRHEGLVPRNDVLTNGFI